ncbi:MULTISPECIES: ORF6N domain-containing protein [Bacillus cereus group]|uniref:ORF6N domain-containing protein n=1 Tax=Bacillus cereus group TaxID=86661 RepID=UPI001AEE0E11|nr:MULTISPECIES: ORF6C domain-containing protein [Bacillus cereus group]QTR79045.1 ORF6C domain-containing protein [Bacillus cytotoxicus]
MTDQLTVANELHILGKQHVAGYEFTGIEGGFGEGKKAMLVKEIAEIHEKEVKHINLRINENRSRFKDGIDIVDLKGTIFEVGLTDHNILSKMMVSKSNNIYLLSERGYAKLLKILEDDTAWELYDQFVDGYFNMREQQIPTDPFKQIELIAAGASNLNKRVTNLEQVIEEQLTIDYGQQRVLEKAKGRRIYFLWNNGHIDKEVHNTTRKLFGLLGKNLKDAFDVNSYRDILKKDFEEAMKFIEGWRPMV